MKNGNEQNKTLGDLAYHGAIWNIGVTIANKIITIVGQIAIAIFLIPADFGSAAIILGLAGPIGAIFSGPLSSILVQRKKNFRLDKGQVAWAFFLLSLVAFVVLGVIISLFWRMCPSSLGWRATWVLAIGWPLNALVSIPQADLMKKLKFGLLARITFVISTVQTILSVGLAWLGFRGWSLLIPVTIVAVLNFIIFYKITGFLPIRKPAPRKWFGLLKTVPWLAIIHGINIYQISGLALLIGFNKDQTKAGLYTWGYAIASQTIFLLANNLSGVLFPILTQLRKHNISEQITLKSVRMMTVILSPVLVLQALWTPWLISHVFNIAWVGAIPIITILSVGLMTRPMTISGAALLMSKGEFRKYATASIMHAILLTLACICGIACNNLRYLAFFNAGAFFIGGWIYLLAAGLRNAIGWRDFNIRVGGLLLGMILATGIGFIIMRPEVLGANLFGTFVSTLAASSISFVTLYLLERDLLIEITKRFRQLLQNTVLNRLGGIRV